MTDIQTEAGHLTGRTAVDRNGDKIGKIADLYVDEDTGLPEWFAISTGLFGTKVSFAPLAGAEVVGEDVMLPFAKSLVKDAPRAEADGHLSRDEESTLYAHYGRSAGTMTGRTGSDFGRERGGPGHDTSGPNTDEAMTRSEEELDIDKRTREAGRARLRKWIETEDVDVKVPVRRETARVVTEPITDANVDAAMSGGELTTEEHEVVLTEEVVDVNKRVVPKERVRLETDVESDEVLVDEQLRKERIEMEEDHAGRSGTKKPRGK